ncbi:13437_t:CDS:2, partial [Acaulospora morrowiae]
KMKTSNNSVYLCVLFLTFILALLPIVKAACSNSAVFSDCMDRASSSLSTCSYLDYICTCDAYGDISRCYLQCTDDPTYAVSASVFNPQVSSICSLAESVKSTKYTKPTQIPTSSITPAATAPTTPTPTPTGTASISTTSK